jgi:hypothetical protein
MPKGIVVPHNGMVSSFQIEKVERAKLYGVRRRLAVDDKGRTCARAALTDDGQVLLRAGMTALDRIAGDMIAESVARRSR